MYKVELGLFLWPLDLLSFNALLYFYDNKYVVILILILIVSLLTSLRCSALKVEFVLLWLNPDEHS